MTTTTCDSMRAQVSVYGQALGPLIHRLTPALARLHGGGPRHVQGFLHVRVGRKPWVQLLMWLTRRPRPSDSARCVVHILPANHGEYWQRTIGDQVMNSFHQAGDEREIIERFGPLAIRLHCRVRRGGLWLRSRGTTLFGLKLPWFLGLQVVAREQPINANTYRCDVRLRSPLLGCLLHYHGTVQLMTSE